MTIEPKSKKSYQYRDKFLFWGFNNVDYDFNQGELRTIKNFLHRMKLMEKMKDIVTSWVYWTINDGETPQTIAYKLYKTEHLYWLVTSLNDIFDMDQDWPMNETLVYKYSVKKYGSDNINSIHHYEADVTDDVTAVPIGTIVPESYLLSRTEISNLQYEIQLNDQKRNIKLLNPDNLGSVLRDFNKIKQQFK